MKLIILALAVPLFLETSVKAANSTFFPSASVATRAVILTQSNWQQFSSTAGNFTVSLPGTPTKESETDDDGSVANNFTVVYGETVYLVTYSDLVDENQVNPEEIFDAVCEGYAADGDKLVNKREIKLNGGYPGRIVELNTTDGMVGKASMYLVKNRLYQLIVISPSTEEQEKFFESFRISSEQKRD